MHLKMQMDSNHQKDMKKKKKHRSPRISMAASSPSNKPRLVRQRGPMIGNGNCISTWMVKMNWTAWGYLKVSIYDKLPGDTGYSVLLNSSLKTGMSTTVVIRAAMIHDAVADPRVGYPPWNSQFAPEENGWLEEDIFWGDGIFSGARC